MWVCENAGTCTKSAEEVGFCKVQMELVEQEVVVGSEPVFRVKWKIGNAQEGCLGLYFIEQFDVAGGLW